MRRCMIDGIGLPLVLVGLALPGAVAGDTPDGAPPDWPEPVKDSQFYGQVLVDRLERGFRSGRDVDVWDAQAWWGSDRDRLWLRAEGEGPRDGSVEASEVQALYSRAVAPFWDLQAGLRYDLRPDPSRSQLVLGVQGLAPYKFETTTAIFVSDEGDVTARAEFEYDFLLTQRWILQPRVEAVMSAQDVDELGFGAGLASTEAGLRLRYEIRREFAPYLGVSWSRSWGDTAEIAREAGEQTSRTSLVIGIRAWF